ncbi:hypothetical protein [Staphylococcus epidermidis]|uniref:hypothetical protein n=1 Tax=Staphylococcus epidermidis TaxID=1282 RepID=UPI00136E3F85|nr:hypothetical protein [Staphylococcus epidermidis]NAM30013.1 hypothetical protein [Staphylococcus epidermidis]NAM67008.1 hypothetical protein [Staphylococcus epidermidis]NAM78559.1 hypothetical protein [Staphylococcus epidermidis]
MALNFAIRKELDEFLDTIALTDIEKFSPSKVSKYADISIDEAFKWLLEHVADEELELLWEIRCPNCNRVLTLNSKKDFEEYECDFCYNDFDVETNDLYPKFRVSKKYKDYLLAKGRAVNSEKKLSKTITNVDDDIPLSDFNLNEEMTRYIKEFLPKGFNIIWNGDIYMNNSNNNNNNNNISDSLNNSKIDNSSIQSTNVNQEILISKQQVEDLEDYIQKIDDEDLRQMNEEFLDNFKTSLKEYDKENAKKWIGYIKNTVNAPIVQTILENLN